MEAACLALSKEGVFRECLFVVIDLKIERIGDSFVQKEKYLPRLLDSDWYMIRCI